MKLNINNLNNKSFWENANIEIPKYDIKKVRDNTEKNPMWIHFGAGNIFRGFLARISDSLLNDNLIDKGIIAVDTHSTGKTEDYDMLEKVYKNVDNLTLLALIKNNGDIDKKIIENEKTIKQIFCGNTKMIENFDFTYIKNKYLALIDKNNNLIALIEKENINGKNIFAFINS